MTQILSNYSASISELKKSPSSLIEAAGGEAVAILNHNKPSAYLVPSELYEKMMDIIDDYYLVQEVRERLNDGEEAIEVDIDELLS
jgi:antitoxin StbD